MVSRDVVGQPRVLPLNKPLSRVVFGVFGAYLFGAAAQQRHKMVPVTDARLQVFPTGGRIHLAIPRIAHDETILGVPQREALRKALDSVEQTASLAVERFLSQAFVGKVTGDDKVALYRSVRTREGPVNVPGIAVTDPGIVNPAFPFEALARERTITRRFQLLERLLAKDVGDGFADKFLGRDADGFGIFTIGVEVAAVPVDKGNPGRNGVEECQQFRFLETGAGVLLARRGAHRRSLTYM
jgi:hypothetical protein